MAGLQSSDGVMFEKEHFIPRLPFSINANIYSHSSSQTYFSRNTASRSNRRIIMATAQLDIGGLI
jgi:hypothetical protein